MPYLARAGLRLEQVNPSLPSLEPELRHQLAGLYERQDDFTRATEQLRWLAENAPGPYRQRLNQLKADLGYVAITTATMLQAEAYWAQLRQEGKPTAPDLALDGDVILAAQAALLIGIGHDVVIATTNVGHLARLVPAEEWQKIAP